MGGNFGNQAVGVIFWKNRHKDGSMDATIDPITDEECQTAGTVFFGESCPLYGGNLCNASCYRFVEELTKEQQDELNRREQNIHRQPKL